MANDAQEILDTILSRLKGLANTETVVGQPVQVGNLTLLPVVRISVGFAAGAGEGNTKANGAGSGGGGGGGGGASVTPVGFISYDGSEVRFIRVGKSRLDALLETVPELVKKINQMRKTKGETGSESGD